MSEVAAENNVPSVQVRSISSRSSLPDDLFSFFYFCRQTGLAIITRFFGGPPTRRAKMPSTSPPVPPSVHPCGSSATPSSDKNRCPHPPPTPYRFRQPFIISPPLNVGGVRKPVPRFAWHVQSGPPARRRAIAFCANIIFLPRRSDDDDDDAISFARERSRTRTSGRRSPRLRRRLFHW